jgi:hypothetical protein
MKNYNKFRLKNIIRTPEEKLIHVKLDAKTRITISKMSQLDVWLIKYPNAEVVSS